MHQEKFKSADMLCFSNATGAECAGLIIEKISSGRNALNYN